MRDNRVDDAALDDAPLDAAAMLALVKEQQTDVSRSMARQIPWILLAWGIVWVVGYGMLWLIDGAKPAFSVPLPIAAAVFIVLMVSAMVLSGVIGARAGRGIRSTASAAFTGIAGRLTNSQASVMAASGRTIATWLRPRKWSAPFC